ncbi:MAG TPA: lysophospholipid acyltransferase family protein [Chitinophagaceae bacterium]|nr:lysophospholipid acyltransferase family protein [Chitinophagaceae bacterium]
MKTFPRFLRVLYSVYAITSFVLLLLIIFPLVLVASLFGKIRGGNIIYQICGLWADVWFLLIGLRAQKTLQSDAPRKDQQYIFVANHISYMDIPMIVKTIRQPTRALGKAEIAKVPIFGFLYRYGAIMVDRSNAEARKKSVLQLKSVLRKGISVFIFPEGTFNETGLPLKEFYDGAFRIAIESQTPVLPVVFPDTVKRLHFSSVLSFTPGKSRAIFLAPVPVEGLTAEDMPALKEKVFHLMQAALVNAHNN